jgi:hypothetical protein
MQRGVSGSVEQAVGELLQLFRRNLYGHCEDVIGLGLRLNGMISSPKIQDQPDRLIASSLFLSFESNLIKVPEV